MKNLKTLGRVIVDRNKWRTGEIGENATGKGENTYLLNSDGSMCCLGFACIQTGIPRNKVLEISSPEDVFEKSESIIIPKFSRVVSTNFRDTKLSKDAIRINDDNKSTPEQKERKLRKLFGKYGIDLEFIGEYYTMNETGKKRKVRIAETI
jgi:hypothetical protein